MKNIYKTLFGLYIFTLLWLLLFKFSADVISVVIDHQARSLNLIPFAGYSHSYHEMIDNVIVFLPFGLLLGVIAKDYSFRKKLGIIVAFSLGVEILQFILAIGISDVTDLITNTLGGFIGLAIYALGNKYSNTKIFDACISIIIAFLVIAIIVLRVFVLRVRY